MSVGGLPDNWEQHIAKLLKRLGIDESKLNEQPMPTDKQGVVTDVRSNADIWQSRADNSGFATAQSNIRAGIEPLQDLLSHSLPEIGQGVMNSFGSPPAFGGTKTLNSPIPAPPLPQEDQRKFAQDASQNNRNQMKSRYMNDANTRSQVARQVTRDHTISKAPSWAQKFINAGPAPRRGGPQEY